MSIDTKFIGKTYPASTYEVGKEKIKEYAKAIKNLDPYYLDDDFAKKSKYGAIIAPPTLSCLRSSGGMWSIPQVTTMRSKGACSAQP